MWTNTSTVPSGYAVSKQYFLNNAYTKAGNQSIPTYDGLTTMVGNANNGYAKITVLSSENIDYNWNNYFYTGAIETVTLEPGTYIFESWGAQGGTGTNGYTSGKGAYARSILTITEPTTYKILVGEQGNNLNTSTGSGGGGTFIATSDNTPIAVAGGGRRCIW